MDKEMVKEKNIMMMVHYLLKGNLKMENIGMEN